MTGVFRSEAGRDLVRRRYREILEQWPVPAEHRIVATRHGATFVVSAGPPDAAPVVVLHGSGTNSSIWLTDAARWSEVRRVHLVDVLGEAGLSAEARPNLESDCHAEWLDDVLDGIGTQRAAFVGASFGGWLALDYAIRRPHRVERVALLAPGGVGGQRYGFLAGVLALMVLGRRRTALRFVLGDTPGLDELIDFMELIQINYRPRRDRLPVFTDEQLRTVVAPLLVVVGGRDRMLDSRTTARRIRHVLPAAVVVEHPEAGHALTEDGPLIADFLADGAPRTVAQVKTALRRDLSSAMKARRSEEVSALRTALATLDNAEAVAPDPEVTATEVARRGLSAAAVDTILRSCIEEGRVEARRYDELGRPDAAQRLRRQADIIAAYLVAPAGHANCPWRQLTANPVPSAVCGRNGNHRRACSRGRYRLGLPPRFRGSFVVRGGADSNRSSWHMPLACQRGEAWPTQRHHGVGADGVPGQCRVCEVGPRARFDVAAGAVVVRADAPGVRDDGAGVDVGLGEVELDGVGGPDGAQWTRPKGSGRGGHPGSARGVDRARPSTGPRVLRRDLPANRRAARRSVGYGPSQTRCVARRRRRGQRGARGVRG